MHSSSRGSMDCFAEPVIGRAFARLWSACPPAFVNQLGQLRRIGVSRMDMMSMVSNIFAAQVGMCNNSRDIDDEINTDAEKFAVRLLGRQTSQTNRPRHWRQSRYCRKRTRSDPKAGTHFWDQAFKILQRHCLRIPVSFTHVVLPIPPDRRWWRFRSHGRRPAPKWASPRPGLYA